MLAIELMLDNLEKKMVVREKGKKNFKRLVKRKFVTFSVRKQDEHRKIEFCKASTERTERKVEKGKTYVRKVSEENSR